MFRTDEDPVKKRIDRERIILGVTAFFVAVFAIVSTILLILPNSNKLPPINNPFVTLTWVGGGGLLGMVLKTKTDFPKGFSIFRLSKWIAVGSLMLVTAVSVINIIIVNH